MDEEARPPVAPVSPSGLGWRRQVLFRLVSLGMVTGILPVVGVTLPLFSYGGSSVLTVMIGLGLLMNVSLRRHQSGVSDRGLVGLRLR